MPLSPSERALVLEDSKELELTYAAAAVRGDSAVPRDPEALVDFHYLCFIKSEQSGKVYEMDGDKKGPVDTAIVVQEDKDWLAEGLKLVKRYIEREKDTNSNFSLMALVPTD